MLRTHELLPVLDGLVYGLIYERLDVCSAPVLAASCQLRDQVFGDVVELAHFFVEDGGEDAIPLLLIGQRNEYL